jgi:hypothetical protein
MLHSPSSTLHLLLPLARMFHRRKRPVWIGWRMEQINNEVSFLSRQRTHLDKHVISQ